MPGVTVETTYGWVRGAEAADHSSWRGVPYAAAERFAAPGPARPWSGIRPALAFGPQCPQHLAGPAWSARTAPPGFSEDCLSLNIWAPRGGGGLKPVFVWIHGGAFLIGGSNLYDGAELARRGDIVVVCINYRLGVLGFVNFADALGLDIPSNLGLRDQIAALAWIRDNIAGFGGDPGRVTIGGESAGSLCVSLLMHCRPVWPLFHGAILQSGALNLIHDRQKSIRVARRYAKALGLRPGELNGLRRLELSRLFAAQAKAGSQERSATPAAPWFDGDLLPDSFAAALREPTAPVPLLAGANREEIRLFEVMPRGLLPRRWPELERVLRSQLAPDHAERILAAYPRTRAGRRALATDLTFLMPTWHFAERHARRNPTWFYRFDYAHPLFGAYHALDLMFLWPLRGLLVALLRGGRMAGRRAALADRIMANWAHFVRHGRPETGWPRVAPDAALVRSLDLEDRVLRDMEPARRAAWDGRDVDPGVTAGASPRPAFGSCAAMLSPGAPEDTDAAG